MEKIDVCIIGAGPAGTATAAALIKLRPGWRDHLVVLEKATHPRHKLCGGGLTPWVKTLLRQLELEADVPSLPIDNVQLFLHDRPLEFKTPGLFCTIRRNEFDAALAKSLRQKGVRLLEKTPARQLIETAEGIRVETEGETFLAKIVVGADGAKSLVRRAFFHETSSRVSRLIEILAPATNGLADEFQLRRAAIDFRPVKRHLQGYIWDFPCWCEGAPHVNIGVFDSRIVAEKPHANLPELLQRHLDERRWNISVDLMGHPERWFHPGDVYSRPRVLLVGDAAGVEPWLGEGISMSLAYGPVAAAALVAALERGDFSFADYRQRLLRDHLGKILRRNRLAARLFYSPKIFSVLPPLGGLLHAYLNHRVKLALKNSHPEPAGLFELSVNAVKR
ncbi:MAG: FAD-dependent monooxygenase [candidate division KSB1 bacterium]|nr:FAD-dependent monooxygenase [candidate division KSB1 bacterium]MDZ7367099.1 FAD-dependent monooxygenase [candidate division KSB1 bacterium]MDZ7405077.1 FAD-dependent monooxygenase [candidate division KSB1 bacterium]